MNKTKVKNAWSKAVNNKDNYPYKDSTYGNKIKGRINIEHYITYNIVRGLPLDRGFTSTDNYYFNRYLIQLDSFVKSWSNGGIFDFFTKRIGEDWLFPYNGLVSEQYFWKKADEALRLHSSS